MATRKSGYARKDFDCYETPSWVTDCLVSHIPVRHKTIWEPACGSGKIVAALTAHGAHVEASDVTDHGCPHATVPLDFVGIANAPLVHYDGIITNPPYGPRGTLADAFIRRGLERLADYGFLALLLPIDFDSAGGRADVFEECPRFAAKIILRKRIKWFDGPASPSQNHAWFIWSNDMRPRSQPVLLYAPKREAA